MDVDGPVRGHLVAARLDGNKAAERKRKLRAQRRKEGRRASRRELTLCEWVVVFTNVEGQILSAPQLTEIYRARWMIEIFFKGLKSGQGLEKWSCHRTNSHTLECLGYAHLTVGVLSLNLWRVMGPHRFN